MQLQLRSLAGLAGPTIVATLRRCEDRLIAVGPAAEFTERGLVHRALLRLQGVRFEERLHGVGY